ncbi:MAG: preprotein translocase subunit SecG [bacterium]
MDAKQISSYAIIVLGVFLIVTILLQIRGSGLGTIFGSSSGGDFYRSRRGIEKFLFNATIISAILFVSTCVVNVLLNKTA